MPSFRLLADYLEALGLDFCDLQEALDQVRGEPMVGLAARVTGLERSIAELEKRFAELETVRDVGARSGH